MARIFSFSYQSHHVKDRSGRSLLNVAARWRPGVKDFFDFYILWCGTASDIDVRFRFSKETTQNH